MVEENIPEQIDRGTIEAFEEVCSLLSHTMLGHFSIFDGAWQVLLFASSEADPAITRPPGEHAQWQATLAEVAALVQAVMRISSEISTFLYPVTLSNQQAIFLLNDKEKKQLEQDLNQTRWAPYDRTAWNAFFLTIHPYIDRVLALLNQLEHTIIVLREQHVERIIESFSDLEPMLTANLRKSLVQVKANYTLDLEDPN